MTSIAPAPDGSGPPRPPGAPYGSLFGPPAAPATRPQGSAPAPAPPPPEPDKSAWKRSTVEWVLVIAGALAIAFLLKATTFQVFYIPSGSMEPTLQVGDRVVVNQWSYRLHDVNRGDIVVFRRPEGETAAGVDDLIKRVVGLPGETVTIKDNQVFINNEPLDEPYLPAGTRTDGTGDPIPCAPENPCHIPDGQVWVMGDNRTNSMDSRWFGPIPESKIVGRAFVRLWPFSRLGGL